MNKKQLEKQINSLADTIVEAADSDIILREEHIGIEEDLVVYADGEYVSFGNRSFTIARYSSRDIDVRFHLVKCIELPEWEKVETSLRKMSKKMEKRIEDDSKNKEGFLRKKVERYEKKVEKIKKQINSLE